MLDDFLFTECLSLSFHSVITTSNYHYVTQIALVFLSGQFNAKSEIVFNDCNSFTVLFRWRSAWTRNYFVVRTTDALMTWSDISID